MEGLLSVDGKFFWLISSLGGKYFSQSVRGLSSWWDVITSSDLECTHSTEVWKRGNATKSAGHIIQIILYNFVAMAGYV